MHLTKHEKETVITWHEESDRVEIYTCSKPVIRRCERLGFKQIDKQHLCREDGGGLISKTFECTRKDILIRKFRPRILSEQQKAEATARLKNVA